MHFTGIYVPKECEFLSGAVLQDLLQETSSNTVSTFSSIKASLIYNSLVGLILYAADAAAFYCSCQASRTAKGDRFKIFLRQEHSVTNYFLWS